MVEIHNDCVIIFKDDPAFSKIREALTFRNSGTRKLFKKGKDGSTRIRYVNYDETEYVFKNYYGSTEEPVGISVPRGLLFFLKPYLKESKLKDYQVRSEFYDFSVEKNEASKYSNILNTITLRAEQIEGIRRMLVYKRCIIQAGTGAGKSEMICGFVELLHKLRGKYPTSLMIVPSVILFKNIKDRLEKYNIPISDFKKERKIIKNRVNIVLPQTLLNALEKTDYLLNDVQVCITDEAHHAKSILFRKAINSSKSLDYSIGMSASAISAANCHSNKLTDFSMAELNIIGATGPMIMNLTSGELVKNNRLATPVVLTLNNKANQFIPEEESNNWHRIVSDKLYSDERNDILCDAVKVFNNKNKKILILVSTIEWSEILLKKLYIEGVTNVYASYGGGKNEKFNGSDFESINENVLEDFDDGKFNILIGTSHLYEGADIQNLDVVVLGFGGKGERAVQQGIGRVLRKTKSGKYAYIVDFNDTGDGILRYHYSKRKYIYQNILKVKPDRFFDGIDVDEIESIYERLER